MQFLTNLFIKFLANLLQRAFGSKPNTMLTVTGVVGALAAALGAFPPAALPAQYQPWLVGAGLFLSALAGALGHGQNAQLPPPSITSPSGKALVFLLVLVLAPIAMAQSDPDNIYGAGVSYSVNGQPAVAGSAIYAHRLSDSGTYAFTHVDALPNTLKPLTVTTNVGAGVAQKVFSIGKVPLYMPTGAGVSFNGSNTGWEWNGGVLAAIHVRKQYFLMPTVRFLKSSVSNGTGYQPIIGLEFGVAQ